MITYPDVEVVAVLHRSAVAGNFIIVRVLPDLNQFEHIFSLFHDGTRIVVILEKEEGNNGNKRYWWSISLNTQGTGVTLDRLMEYLNTSCFLDEGENIWSRIGMVIHTHSQNGVSLGLQRMRDLLSYFFIR